MTTGATFDPNWQPWSICDISPLSGYGKKLRLKEIATCEIVAIEELNEISRRTRESGVPCATWPNIVGEADQDHI